MPHPSRRRLLSLLAASVLCLSVLGLIDPVRPGVAAPAAPAGPALARVLPEVEEYHDVDGAAHQQHFDQLSTEGYRMVSLSIYGDPAAPSYAAVWVERSGVPYVAFHGLTAAQVENFDAQYAPEGFYPVILSGTGPEASARFAGVWEQNGSGATYSIGVGEDTLELIAKNAQESDGQFTPPWHLTSVDAFGDPGAPLYAYITEPNTRRVNHDLTTGLFLPAEDATTQGLLPGGVRPLATTLYQGADRLPRETTIWDDSRVGRWYQESYLSATELDQAVDDARAGGLYPIRVDGAVIGGRHEFVAIFAEQDRPLPRTMTVTGTASKALIGFDKWMKAFMKAHSLRAGSLAIARKGKLVYARAFTWAEADYPTTEPTSVFRIASSSKPLTAMAVMRLVDDGTVTLDTPVQPIIDVVQPNGAPPADPRWNGVTVENLLCQNSGMPAAFHLFADQAVASAYGTPLPVTVRQEAGWAAQLPLEYDPGVHYEYRNGNFALAGLLIEALSGQAYEQFVRGQLFAPLGVTRPALGHSLADERLPGEVRYDSPVAANEDPAGVVVTTSVNGPGARPVAESYGGWNQAKLGAAGGWVLAPADWVKVLSSFHDGNSPLYSDPVVSGSAHVDQVARTMWNGCPSGGRPDAELGWYRGTHVRPNGTKVTFHEHNGGLPSTAFLVVHTRGLSFAIGFNRRLASISGAVEGDQILDIADGVTDWPTTDLFPSVGIPKG